MTYAPIDETRCELCGTSVRVVGDVTKHYERVWPSDAEIDAAYLECCKESLGSTYDLQVWRAAVDWLRERMNIDQ